MNSNKVECIYPSQVINSTHIALENISSSDETQVLKIIRKKDGQQEAMAWKVIQNENFKEKGTLNVMQNSFHQMAKWESPYIMKCFGCSDGLGQTKVQIEYLNGVNLRDYLLNFMKKSHNSLYFLDAVAIAKQVVLCIKALHSLKKRQHGYLKLTDFVYHNGTLKITNNGDNFFGNQISKDETNSLFSPEVLNHETPTEKSDVWSIGAILLIALTWRETNQQFSMEVILEKFKQTSFPHNIHQILGECLNKEPKARISLSDLQILLDKILQDDDLPHTLKIYTMSFSENKIHPSVSFSKIEVEKVEQLSKSQFAKQLQKFQEKTSSNSFQDAQKLYHQVVKSKYILENIIHGIQDCVWGRQNKNKKIYGEILYLFYSRVFLSVTRAWEEIKKIKDKDISCSVLVQLSRFYERVKKDFYKICAQLTQREKGLIQSMKYRIAKFWNGKKYIYMEGMETKDFSKEQHTDFTVDYIEKNLIGKLKMKEFKLFQKLKKYKNIVQIEYEEFVDFEVQVQKVLKQKE